MHNTDLASDARDLIIGPMFMPYFWKRNALLVILDSVGPFFLDVALFRNSSVNFQITILNIDNFSRECNMVLDLLNELSSMYFSLVINHNSREEWLDQLDRIVQRRIAELMLKF